MADIPAADKPDTAAALTLALIGLQTLTQTVEGIATAPVIPGIRRAQRNFDAALALLTTPADDPPSPPSLGLPSREPAEAVEPAPPSDEPPPADPPPSPDPQPEDKDG